MSKLSVTKGPMEGIYIIEPTVFYDERGYFMETYNDKELREQGLDIAFVQDNESFSRKGTLRALHFQHQHPQGKLVRVISGEVFDVAVDIRRDSPTYGQWAGWVLSAENKKQLYIPVGFAHGYLTLSDTAQFLYKCTDYYYPEDQGGIIWNDEDIGVQWPVEHMDELYLSEKDQRLPSWKIFDKG